MDVPQSGEGKFVFVCLELQKKKNVAHMHKFIVIATMVGGIVFLWGKGLFGGQNSLT